MAFEINYGFIHRALGFAHLKDVYMLLRCLHIFVSEKKLLSVDNCSFFATCACVRHILIWIKIDAFN